MKYKRKKSKFRYEEIVENLSSQIKKCNLNAGEKLIPVRRLSETLGVSVNTVLQAYSELENLGLIESKPQSGYFVRNLKNLVVPEIKTLTAEIAVKTYKGEELITNAHEIANIKGLVSFGGGVVSEEILPKEKLNKIMIKTLKELNNTSTHYEFPPGYYKLRKELSKISSEWSSEITPEDIIITSGAAEAISLSLKAIAKPEDTIITESPTFYMLSPMIKSLGMKVLEVPTNPKSGIDVNHLKNILQSYKISGCITYPTLNSPTGSIMPEENRESLYKLLSTNDIPIIECDIWGELHFLNKKPKPIKSFDKDGDVIYLSSLTKTGAPGLRIGWCIPGKYFKRIKELKYMHSIATSTFSQIVATEYIRSGVYKKSISNLKKTYQTRLNIMYQLVSTYFPNGTRMIKPQGGAFLWIELPSNVNSIKLQELAIENGITINPGPIFSTRNCFSNYIRLSCVCDWEIDEVEKAIKTLGDLTKNLQV